MANTEQLIWTALPNGITGSELKLSVFLAPQLTADTPPGDTFPPLSQITDFVDWPGTIGAGISFSVTLVTGGGTFVVPATNVTPAPPVGVNPSTAWKAIFDENTTQVEPFVFEDLSLNPKYTFPVGTIASFISDIYGTIGTNYPTDPIIISASRQTDYNFLAAGDATAQAIINDLEELARVTSVTTNARPRVVPPTPLVAFEDLYRFHQPVVYGLTPSRPKTPTLDFHAGLTALANYPVVLRMFNIVFDLVVPIPSGMGFGNLTVQVHPTWTKTPGSPAQNISPFTAATYNTNYFRPTPMGPDYANGMLNLNDPARFFVTDLDTDLGGDRLIALGTQLVTTQNAQAKRRSQRYGGALGGQAAVTVPALRTAGPQVVWNNYANAANAGFAGLLDGQLTLANALAAWQSNPSINPLPTIFAEQLIRGHRVDVYSLDDVNPSWRSLHGRFGTYKFGPDASPVGSIQILDEGMITPGAGLKTTDQGAVTGELTVHEAIFRWKGWGLSAQRPGTQIDLTTPTTVANPGNKPPAPTPTGPNQPQLGAYFIPPSPTNDPTPANPDYLFPKLRFGNRYQFRARGVDLAGNSEPLSSSDASTATAVFTHYRYEPVRPPTLAGTAPFVPGEGTYYLVLLDEQISSPPTPNGRWVFPPRGSVMLAEEHGMLDGFVMGSPPDPTKPPAGDGNTYLLMKNLDNTDLSTMPTVKFKFAAPYFSTFDTDSNQNVPYFTGSPTPWTPYIVDPLSAGPVLTGLPGAAGPVSAPWHGIWPTADPFLLELSDGVNPTSTLVLPSGSTPGQINVTLPPAETAIVRLSSALTPTGLGLLGQYQWFTPADPASFQGLALDGQVWMLTPFQVLKMVHAVRTPLIAPEFQAPTAYRVPGAVTVDIDDPKFLVDDKSTGAIQVAATWTDIYDVPSDPTSDPGAPPSAAPSRKSTITSSGPAFHLTVPDPAPMGPEAQPLTIIEPLPPFQVHGNAISYTHEESATHHIGDTKHHLVHYTATGTSRFAEMFRKSATLAATVGTALTVTDATLGLNAAATEVLINNTLQVQGPTSDYTVDEKNGQITILATAAHPSGAVTVDITYEPTVIKTGTPTPVHVLSSAPPKVPVISQIVPAWQLKGPAGSLATGGIGFERVGGFLRVYLERPWYSSGDGELLGVVTTVTAENSTSTFPTPAQQKFVTMMGIDPINYIGVSQAPWPVVPTAFANLAPVPIVPYRPPYSHPPQMALAEDPSTEYMVWPYAVNYDEGTGRWYADIAPRPGITQEGTYPPPGYFIRLALVRFQPYSLDDPSSALGPIETSPVALATFAQPVPDRSVIVLPNTADATHSSVLVTVSGPGYQGFRPPQSIGGTPGLEYDPQNYYAPEDSRIYGTDIVNTLGTEHSSTVVAEVQIQNPALNKLGLIGELAWETLGTPTRLAPTFGSDTIVTWGTTPSKKNNGLVKLPHPTSSTVKMRLRISEIDYYQGSTAPSTIDTSLRRPFVSIIDLN